MKQKKLFVPILLLVFSLGLSLSNIKAQDNPNTITFDNQSGQPALVKLIGPTSQLIEVLNAQKQTVNVSEGEYYILTRYGSKPEEYRYSKGDSFTVTQTATQYSEITITLHKVIGGNYATHTISAEEFGTAGIKHIEPSSQPNHKEKSVSEAKVALVNGSVITQEKFDRELSIVSKKLADKGIALNESRLQLVKKQVLENLIAQELLYQEGQRIGIKFDDVVINEQVTEMKNKFSSEAEFKRAMIKLQISESTLKAELGRVFVIKQLLKDKGDENGVNLYVEKLKKNATVERFLDEETE